MFFFYLKLCLFVVVYLQNVPPLTDQLLLDALEAGHLNKLTDLTLENCNRLVIVDIYEYKSFVGLHYKHR